MGKFLTNIRVIELGHYIAAPFCGQMLSDFGAEVIKVEPLSGEASRNAAPFLDGESLYFPSMNRNKKSLALDLKHDEAREALHRLVETADIVLCNYAVGVPERLGVGFEDLKAVNPNIIYVRMTGYGLTGPERLKPAFDGIVQSLSGFVDLTGFPDGPPVKSGLYVADHLTALYGCIATLAALQRRATSDEAQYLDIAMLDSMMSLLAYTPSYASVLNTPPRRNGNSSTNVFASIFPSSDGYVNIAPMAPKMWIEFSELIGKPEWHHADSPLSTPAGRLDAYDEIVAHAEKWTRQYTSAELIEILESRRIACGKVRSVAELFDDAQIQERGMLAEVSYKDMDVTVPGRVVRDYEPDAQAPTNIGEAPGLGSDSHELLTSLGLSGEAIDALVHRGIVGRE